MIGKACYLEVFSYIDDKSWNKIKNKTNIPIRNMLYCQLRYVNYNVNRNVVFGIKNRNIT